MTTVTVKIPEALDARLESEAERRRTSKSAVIRNCLEDGLVARKRFLTCADLARDLIGSQPGATDASTNKRYLKDLGLERKRNSR